MQRVIQTIKVAFQKLGIYVDGTKKASTEALIYKGTTYVPIRSVGNSIGKQVGLIHGGLYIGKQPKLKYTEDQAIDLLYKKIKNDANKYKLHYTMDGTDGSRYIIRAYEDFPDHIATYGFFYVDMYTGKVTMLDTVTAEEKSL
ncbi:MULTISPECIES: hypothetical protein [Paenibacillus]|uniref:hypothetical protein n=1 Tax=Paenibacillus TaxID=44249 RepID=UPI002FDF0F9F